LKIVDKFVKSLVLDTFIEQRKYVRLYFGSPIFDIVVDRYTGFLKDISLKGFRVKFREFPPSAWFSLTIDWQRNLNLLSPMATLKTLKCTHLFMRF